MPQLVILRGPAASGKSTVAALLKKSLENKTAHLDFDVFRDNFLGKQGEYYPAAAKMLIATATIALDSEYNVIIDGFYRMEDYPDLLPKLVAKHPGNTHMFCFDVSLETTIKRHAKRAKSKKFGEKELRDWYYKPKASGIYEFEYKIPETFSATETVGYIRNKLG